MSNITVKLLKGRTTYNLTLSPTSSFSVLRALAEAETGSTTGGLRLLFKGRCPPENTTLQSAGVTNGSTLMALPTAKQRQLDQQKAKATNPTTNQQPTQSVTQPPPAISSARHVGGDKVIAGAYFVMVRQGRSLWRVNIDPDATVGMLRARVASLVGIGVDKIEVRLLSKGRCLKDDTAQIAEAGVKRGGEIMIMFGGGVHGRREHRLDVVRLDEDIQQLERCVQQVCRKRRARLMDDAAWAVDRGAQLELMRTMRDNVDVLVKESDTKTAFLRRLDEVDRCIRDVE
eukprot:GFKZ01004717.1.p1 GENE.GFKZ01004717.1~~GFKZ01004717.1.p1  ORF type:complete len:300 (+),score=43.50 GFKZ01004717.1:40-900(+)